MNLSISQWWTAVILDVPIKTAFTYGLASLISLGMIAAGGFEPVITCLVLAVSLSSLHFLCLIFGGRFVGSFEATNIRRSRLVRFVLVLISANIPFILSVAALLSVSGDVYNGVAMKRLANRCGKIIRRSPWPDLAMLLLALAFLFLGSSQSSAQAEAFNVDNYHRAVEYCRGTVARPFALSPDQTIFCFDGNVEKDASYSLLADLKDDGLFVVRSAGGDIASAVALSNLIVSRRATVVVYDYCLASCANYLLIASDQAYVLKGTLVAWDYESTDPALPSCSRYASVRLPSGEFRLQRGSCRPMPEKEADWRRVVLAQNRFFRQRVVDPLFEAPPDNRYLRKITKNLYADSFERHHLAWTLHPRYFAKLFKTKIVYEDYPHSQTEIDDMVSRLQLPLKVIFDP